MAGSFKMSTLTRVLAAVSFGFAVLLCSATAVATTPLSSSSAHSHYERPSTRGGPYKDRVIVFVHGIFGDADGTWRYSASVYWPQLLLTDDAFRDSDVYVASYSSPYFGNTMNIDEVVTSLNNRLISDEVFSKHREVVFVCHSLGGLVVQSLLLTFREYAQQVPFIYFFSTPETGAQIANLASVFSSDPLLKTMFAGDENVYLQNLENQWKAAPFHIRRLCAYEKKQHKGVLVVDRLSGTRNCDEPPIPINENHLGIVKPDGPEHESYIALRNAVLAKPTSHKLRTQASKRKELLGPIAKQPPVGASTQDSASQNSQPQATGGNEGTRLGIQLLSDGGDNSPVTGASFVLQNMDDVLDDHVYISFFAPSHITNVIVDSPERVHVISGGPKGIGPGHDTALELSVPELAPHETRLVRIEMTAVASGNVSAGMSSSRCSGRCKNVFVVGPYVVQLHGNTGKEAKSKGPTTPLVPQKTEQSASELKEIPLGNCHPTQGGWDSAGWSQTDGATMSAFWVNGTKDDKVLFPKHPQRIFIDPPGQAVDATELPKEITLGKCGDTVCKLTIKEFVDDGVIMDSRKARVLKEEEDQFCVVAIKMSVLQRQ